MKVAMAEEKKKKYCTWFITGLIFAVITSIGAIMYILRAANVRKWDADVDKAILFPGIEDPGYTYDLYPLI